MISNIFPGGFILILLIVVLFLGFGKILKPKGSIDEELLKSGGLLVDVRSPGVYERNHLEGAINIPLETLMSNPSEVSKHIPYKGTKVLVYCRSGSRSEMAVKILKSNGFRDVHNIGGIGA